MTKVLEWATLDEIAEHLRDRPNDDFILIINKGEGQYHVHSNEGKPPSLIFHQLLTVQQKWIEGLGNMGL